MATYTYDLDSPGDRERVRFALGDTSAPYVFSDEEIAFMLSEMADWRRVVIACLRSVIGRLAQPDFQADWLRVELSTARDAYRALLAEKLDEYSFNEITGTLVSVSRSDWNNIDA